jgi:hypothetical protein
VAKLRSSSNCFRVTVETVGRERWHGDSIQLTDEPAHAGDGCPGPGHDDHARHLVSGNRGQIPIKVPTREGALLRTTAERRTRSLLKPRHQSLSPMTITSLFVRANAAWDAGSVKEAFRLFSLGARAGNAACQSSLGYFLKKTSWSMEQNCSHAIFVRMSGKSRTNVLGLNLRTS